MSTEGSTGSRTEILQSDGSVLANAASRWLESLTGASGVQRLLDATGICILEVRYDDKGRQKVRYFSAEERSKEGVRVDEFDAAARVSRHRSDYNR